MANIILVTTLICLLSTVCNGVWIDLSHTYNESTLFWPTSTKFKLESEMRGFKDDIWISTNRFCTGEHSGTHLDAPFHFFHEGWTTEEIPLQHLAGVRAAVIDISDRVSSGVGPAEVTVDDLETWEAVYRRIPDNAIVIMHSGWSRHWFDPSKYFNMTDSEDIDKGWSFPALSQDATKWLVENRKIVGVGVDSPSADGQQSAVNHVTLSAQNIYILENLVHVDQLPADGAIIYAFPMKIGGGSGAPCRVLAKIDDESYGPLQLLRDGAHSISLL